MSDTSTDPSEVMTYTGLYEIGGNASKITPDKGVGEMAVPMFFSMRLMTNQGLDFLKCPLEVSYNISLDLG